MPLPAQPTPPATPLDNTGLHPALLLGVGAAICLLWLGLWWNLDDLPETAGILLPGSNFPNLAEIAQVAVVGILVTGIGGLGFTVGLMQRRQARLVAALELSQRRQTEAEQRLRRNSADMERIAEVTAHDLQEPLRRLVAYAQLLEDHHQHRQDDEARLYVSHVVDAARRMRALISGLRSFVATESLSESSLSRTAPASAVAAARKRLDETLADTGAALIVDPLPEVRADHGSLVEIFVQLLDNAIRFRAEDRRPLIHVSARRDGMQVRFEVRDNGRGMAQARMDSLFEIFSRPHARDMGAGDGIGMGLAVVRRLVERQGGSVWAESAEGVGSRIGFSLPADSTSNRSEKGAEAA